MKTRQTLVYPSKHFKKGVENLVSKHESFTIVIPKKHRKSKLVFDMIENVFHSRGETLSKITRAIRTFQIFDFYQALSLPMSEHLKGGNYKVTYEHNGDLVIFIEAV